jgi:predicted  nucleic acid-binding Zn-ribbon protein
MSALPADETLSRWQVECAAATQQLQAEIGAIAETAQIQQRQLEQLEDRLAEVTSSAEIAVAAQRRAEEELARIQATLTWRLRGRLLRLGALCSALAWSRRVRRSALRLVR